MNTEITTWISIATAITLLLTSAGLELVHNKFSDKKKIISTLAMSYLAFCMATFSLAFVCYLLTYGVELHSFSSHTLALFSQNISSTPLVVSNPEMVFIIFPGIVVTVVAAMISISMIVFSKMRRNRV